MSLAEPPRLIEDSHERKKLKVSLPGGRYQLSLDDGGVILLCDRLGYNLRDTVPDLLVKILVATGDAWFPHERDYEQVIADLPETMSLPSSQIEEVVHFLESLKVPPTRIAAVRDVVVQSPLAEEIDPEEIAKKDLPTPPSGVFETTPDPDEIASLDTDTDTATGVQDKETDSATQPAETAHRKADAAEAIATRADTSATDLETSIERLVERGATLEEAIGVLERQYAEDTATVDIFDIPGVGTMRGYRLISANLDDVAELAESRPVDLSEEMGLNEQMATTIVEGARELVGGDESTAEQLARQTGTDKGAFDTALSMLAAAGVPPSAADDTLRELYGPSVAEIDAVDARMAYFLHEAGYRTPWEVTQATVEELATVDYLGQTTAENVRDDAQRLLNE